MAPTIPGTGLSQEPAAGIHGRVQVVWPPCVDHQPDPVSGSALPLAGEDGAGLS